MKKNKLFNKLNIKDYNNQLEKVLENKVYSLNTKNLLLNMFYEIENSYADYEETKRQVPLKSYFIQYLINTIQKKCTKIDIIKNNSHEGQMLLSKENGYVINHNEITVLENEKCLLEAILEISRNEIKIPKQYKYIDEAFRKLLTIGATINQTEVIRDFNGWSWSISKNNIKDYRYNIVYQTLNYIVDCNLMYEFIDNNNVTLDYIKILNEQVVFKFGDKIGKKFNDIMYKNIMYLYAENNTEVKEQLLKLKDKYKKQLEIMKDKENFIKELTNEKKRFNKKIDTIDKLLNNKELIKEQYEKRNKKLKDINLEMWVNTLKKERKDLLKKINECNTLIKPKEYIKKIENLEYKFEFLEQINNDKLIELCQTFLMGLNQIIKKTENKKELIELIYKLRYYRYIPYKGEFLKDVKELKISFYKTMKLLISKACKLKVLEIISEDEKENFIILKMLFNTQVIDLQNINVELKYQNDILYLQYYDGKILESKIEANFKNIKIKKKTKIFI